jgi:hypothetical protein
VGRHQKVHFVKNFSRVLTFEDGCWPSEKLLAKIHEFADVCLWFRQRPHISTQQIQQASRHSTFPSLSDLLGHHHHLRSPMHGAQLQPVMEIADIIFTQEWRNLSFLIFHQQWQDKI